MSLENPLHRAQHARPHARAPPLQDALQRLCVGATVVACKHREGMYKRLQGVGSVGSNWAPTQKGEYIPASADRPPWLAPRSSPVLPPLRCVSRPQGAPEATRFFPVRWVGGAI